MWFKSPALCINAHFGANEIYICLANISHKTGKVICCVFVYGDDVRVRNMNPNIFRYVRFLNVFLKSKNIIIIQALLFGVFWYFAYIMWMFLAFHYRRTHYGWQNKTFAHYNTRVHVMWIYVTVVTWDMQCSPNTWNS